ncbi:hypothetical protein ACTQ5B_00480 [Bifidobacterium pseudolongum]|uniref:hypothetical protein n=1 Tax=Bifidobacterium pseudolongum TaxID=1694 RepID=UPI003F933DC8
MTAQKPVYSRPSGDDPMPAPKRKRRKRVHTTDTLAAAQVKEIANLDTIEVHPTTGAHHTRNQRTHRREKRRASELRAENEKLHRRLAAIYDALTLQ